MTSFETLELVADRKALFEKSMFKVCDVQVEVEGCVYGSVSADDTWLP